MAVNIITREDLIEFREQLLQEIKKILSGQPAATKKWLRSYEVKKMLNISPGTLQNMRINGSLHPKKIGGIHFYDYDEICKLLAPENKTIRR